MADGGGSSSSGSSVDGADRGEVGVPDSAPLAVSGKGSSDSSRDSGGRISISSVTGDGNLGSENTLRGRRSRDSSGEGGGGDVADGAVGTVAGQSSSGGSGSSFGSSSRGNVRVSNKFIDVLDLMLLIYPVAQPAEAALAFATHLAPVTPEGRSQK